MSTLGARPRNAARAMRRVQMRGGARRPHARRTRVGGVQGHVWAPQTKVRRFDNLARCVARRSRAPYLRRWALILALAPADPIAGETDWILTVVELRKVVSDPG